MAIFPEYADFEAEYSKGKNQVIYTRLAADLDTPVSLMMKLSGDRKDSFFVGIGDGR
jgi:anthranilate synthase component 1